MKTNDEYTGGSTTYYQVDVTYPINEQAQPYTAECQDIIDALGMTFNEGNAFKALWRRCAARTLGKSKRGYTDGLYDAEKVVFYGERLVQLEQLQRKADGVEQRELTLPRVVPKTQGAKPGDCLACGQFGGHGGLPCPNVRPTAVVAQEALAAENQRIAPAPKWRCCEHFPECVHNITL